MTDVLNVHEKLWFILEKDGVGHRRTLSYMTYYQDNAAFRKRRETGYNWAYGYWYGPRPGEDRPDIEKAGTIIDNEPVSGMKILRDVGTRYRSSAKYVRVEDPRGFTVEIPVEALLDLAFETSILNGNVPGKCVWARSGSNHVPLPITSPRYKEIVKVDKKGAVPKANNIRAADLKVGDIVSNKIGDLYMLVHEGPAKIVHTFKVWSIDEEFTERRPYYSLSTEPAKIITKEGKIHGEFEHAEKSGRYIFLRIYEREGVYTPSFRVSRHYSPDVEGPYCFYSLSSPKFYKHHGNHLDRADLKQVVEEFKARKGHIDGGKGDKLWDGVPEELNNMRVESGFWSQTPRLRAGGWIGNEYVNHRLGWSKIPRIGGKPVTDRNMQGFYLVGDK